MNTVTGLPGGLPAMLEDASAEHQIRILTDYSSGTAQLVVTCTCLRDGDRQRFRHGQEIERRTGAFPACDALAAWRSWHEEQERRVAS